MTSIYDTILLCAACAGIGVVIGLLFVVIALLRRLA
jgi:hypothetical protein